MTRKMLGINVLEAAKNRIEEAILTHEDFYLSFSGGKDSGVLAHLVIEAAKKLNRLPVKVVFSDLEVIYKETARYVKSIMELEEVEPYWLCLEELDDNSNSVYQRYFMFWGENEKPWARDMPNMPYVINKHNIPAWLKEYYNPVSVEDWTITSFGEALCDKNNTSEIVNFIGMRTDESYGRLMNIRSMKHRDKKNNHTYRYVNKTRRTWVCLPIYDWSTSDIWHYYAITGRDYNRVYDSMMRLGIPAHAQRTCSAFTEEAKGDLHHWSLIEPDTWARMVSRVEGANFGKIYNHTNLNRLKIRKPENISWKEYVQILLASLPTEAAEIFKDKFKIAFDYHHREYFKKEGILPKIYIQDSRKDVVAAMKKYSLTRKYFISWETLAWAIIKRDFVFKRYGFGYSKKMEERIKKLYEKYGDL